ncbi:MAG: SDR family oxidoreductase [Bacteroidota bacterium]
MNQENLSAYTTPFHTGPISGLHFLVTGGAGFIGSNIVEYLLSFGAGRVRVLDNFSTGHRHNLAPFAQNPAFELFEGDIRNPATCAEACKDIHIVLHQAALGSVPRSLADPLTTNDVNITGHLNMLEAARANNVQRFVYAASSSTYGDHPVLPKKEENIGNPLSPYAVTKYVNELYAGVYFRTWALPVIGLRYFNVFGPRQDPNGAYAAVIPLFIRLMKAGQSPVINGAGLHTRDFTFVENAVQANIRAALTNNADALGQVFNVAVGDRTNLNQMTEIIGELTRCPVKPIHGPERPGDIRDSLADISKAAAMLGYAPQVRLYEGLKRTVEWFGKG